MTGIMSIRGKLSSIAEFLQLDICGLTAEQALARYKNYKTNIPVMLHGDWDKIVNNVRQSENNINKRKDDYIQIIKLLQKEGIEILGLTLHPPKRSKNVFSDFLSMSSSINEETDIPVMIENRSSKSIFVSYPDEIIALSFKRIMTIDIPQLFISCDFNEEIFYNTLSEINWENVREVHVGNLVRWRGANQNFTSIAKDINIGEIDYFEVSKYIANVPYKTLEILGGNRAYERNKIMLEFVKEED